MAFDIPSAAEVEAARRGKPLWKGKSRLELKADEKPRTLVTEKSFKADVWTRDHGHCRCCGRKVLKTLEHVPGQGHVHHLHGRIGVLRFEARCAILLCALCHERVTGRVNDRLFIEGSRTLLLLNEKTGARERYLDARKRLRFREAA